MTGSEGKVTYGAGCIFPERFFLPSSAFKICNVVCASIANCCQCSQRDLREDLSPRRSAPSIRLRVRFRQSPATPSTLRPVVAHLDLLCHTLLCQDALAVHLAEYDPTSPDRFSRRTVSRPDNSPRTNQSSSSETCCACSMVSRQLTPPLPCDRPTRSPHFITRTEALRGAANRVLFSQFYILLYLGMALLSYVHSLSLPFEAVTLGN